ncbi:hypothetical protein QC762_0063100 [Podospora pseudocomata]|uniref:Uncharacterized protein n=1 Tax=Podospora pseudocomata TaxID=2093779 RepID=A0ABR0GEJ5_9PEZI|nr:hypothetical protein QC762_0063100 [Podospora pseudocomata]
MQPTHHYHITTTNTIPWLSILTFLYYTLTFFLLFALPTAHRQIISSFPLLKKDGCLWCLTWLVAIVQILLWPVLLFLFLFFMGAASIARNCFGEGQTCVGIDWNKSRGRTRNAHDEEEQRGTRELAEDGEEGPVCDDDTETLYGLDESEGMELLSYRQDDQACKTGGSN